MWRVDDCFFNGYVFYYWICELDMSVISFEITFTTSTVVDYVVVTPVDTRVISKKNFLDLYRERFIYLHTNFQIE